MPIIECPRCDEGDERHEGRNRCGLCEYTFTVKNGLLINTIVNTGDDLHKLLGSALKQTADR